MERYSGTQTMEAVPVDPLGEWVATGGDTGLEEPMWQLGLGGFPPSYPERPDEPDCIYYLRTGFCGYGNRCRFNHPPDRGTAMGAFSSGGGEYPERPGQPVCQYYMKTWTCKFGATCKYDHPKHGIGSSAPMSLNVYGYPIRLGEKECSYYVKTGECKFGVSCKFNHPEPSGMQLPVPEPGLGPLAVPAALPAPTIFPSFHTPSVQSSQQYGVIPGNWPITRPSMLPGSYVPTNYGPVLFPSGVFSWTPYPTTLSPGTSTGSQPTAGGGSIYGINQMPPSTVFPGAYVSITAGAPGSSKKESPFPERPGQPECQYYLKTGDCKFGATCRYNHPPEWNYPKTNFMLSPMGLPLRPGARICTHYSQNGVCKFGPSCKFDHPMGTMSYSPSASSLTDMPVAPYPVGSTNATLAPSSSSSDLRHELLSGINKDQSPPQMSSMNSSSASVGSILSRSGPPSQISIQHSGQGNIASDSDNSIGHGGRVQSSN